MIGPIRLSSGITVENTERVSFCLTRHINVSESIAAKLMLLLPCCSPGCCWESLGAHGTPNIAAPLPLFILLRHRPSILVAHCERILGSICIIILYLSLFVGGRHIVVIDLGSHREDTTVRLCIGSLVEGGILRARMAHWVSVALSRHHSCHVINGGCCRSCVSCQHGKH